MKRFIFITLCMLLVSCEKDEVETQYEEVVVLKGILIAGDQLASIGLGTIQSIGYSSIEEPIEGASVFIAGGGQESVLGETEESPGVYSTPVDGIIILPGHDYQVDVVVNGQELTALAYVPELLNFISISDPTLIVDENDPGQLVFETSWVEAEGYEYVFVLEEPFEDPVQIDFSVASGNFRSVHGLPTEKTFLRIYDTDLKFYGSHLLHIYKIDLAYSDLFRYSPAVSQNVFNGPDNIIGGAGYYTGVSLVTLELEVEEL
ncbi:MAG: hypothetical protein ACI84C_002500 [Flavobacteriales bacterium]|jgi:hypothetical protein